MFALEVQQLVDEGQVEGLEELVEAYDLPEERAQDMVEACCKRFISQQLTLALRAAKRFDEQEAMKLLVQIIKFVPLVSGEVDADGNLFTEEDKKRLIGFYQAELDAREDAELLSLTEQYGDLTGRLRELVNLTEAFVPPQQGIEGLMGKGQSLEQLLLEKAQEAPGKKKPWAWG